MYGPRKTAPTSALLRSSPLSHIDDSLGKAFCGIVDLVGDVLEEMEESGEMPPEPFSERRFSGKLPLRITPEQHRKLATEAACAGVSINRLIASKL